MAIAREEWSQVTGFQRVRSTIRIFAATVYAQQQRGKAGEWAPALIGPGDLPLSDSAVARRCSDQVWSRMTARSRTTAASPRLEVVNNDETGGTARRQDIERTSLMWGDANPAGGRARRDASSSSQALSARCAPVEDAAQAPPRSRPPAAFPTSLSRSPTPTRSSRSSSARTRHVRCRGYSWAGPQQASPVLPVDAPDAPDARQQHPADDHR